MSDTFKLTGGYTVTPLGNPLSFAPSMEAVIDEAVTIKAKTVGEQLLSADAPAAVDFGGVASANVVILKAVGGKVRARITSADGSSQAVPFDTYWILMSDTVPVTAIDLTRLTGIDTTVRIFLGEKA